MSTEEKTLQFSQKMQKQEEDRKKWVQRQMTGFLYWVNSYLQRQEMKIDNIMTGFSDGVYLIKFLEMLTNQKMSKKYSDNPKLRVHKITNCYLGLGLLDGKVRGLTISSEDLVDGENVPAILGFCWQLLRQFQDTATSDAPEDSSKKMSSFENRLLAWVKHMVADYGVEIEDWSSFNDGRALLTLVHIYENQLVDLDTFDTSDVFNTCKTAIDLSESGIGIPSELLDPQELVDGSVSEKNMALYITLFYNAFKERENLLSKEKLISMINSLEEQIEMVTKEIEEYDSQITTIGGDMKNLGDQMAKEQNEIAELENWKTKTQAEWAAERDDMQKEISGLENEIEDLKQKSGGEIATLQAESEAILNEKNSLLAEVDALTLEIKQVKKDSVDLYKKTKREKKASEKLEEYFQSTVALREMGMSIVRRNTLAHFHDVNIWTEFLGGGEVVENYEPNLTEEDLDKLEAVPQYERLNEFIGVENVRLQDMLNSKLNDAKEVKLKEEKEKEEKAKERKNKRKIKVVKN